MVVWSCGYEEKVDLDLCDLLLTLIFHCDFQKLLSQLVLSHLEIKDLKDLPLNLSIDTVIGLCYVQFLGARVKD